MTKSVTVDQLLHIGSSHHMLFSELKSSTGIQLHSQIFTETGYFKGVGIGTGGGVTTVEQITFIFHAPFLYAPEAFLRPCPGRTLVCLKLHTFNQLHVDLSRTTCRPT